MRVDILTLFPGMFSTVFDESIPKIAREKGALSFHVHNLRDWSANRHAKTDDRPFGGGPGMVMTCQPICDAVTAVGALVPDDPPAVFFLTPEGRRFSQNVAVELAALPRLLLVCGRYEGFDERVFDLIRPEPGRLSLGDFVLSGGEIAAMAMVDAVLRLLPGVLGCEGSLAEESFNRPLLDYPHYTQPAEFRGLTVPEVLRGGDHAKIAAWRHARAVERTRRFRPDLFSREEAP